MPLHTATHADLVEIFDFEAIDERPQGYRTMNP
jgi:hypothetical protein